MKVVGILLTLLFVVGGGAATAQEPVGNLAQVMRAILFPNSNLLYDVQSGDPEEMGKSAGGTSVTSTFSGIYKGWMVVDQAAIALAEVEPLITLEGRLCENGKPVPTTRDDYKKWAAQLTQVGKDVLAASEKKDRDGVIELTNRLAGVCEDCHIKYRRYEDRCRQ
jgi:hypothetical protein